ncbi:MAG TPA: glycosyltransferase family 1 protein [Candidatus Saccharimonadales bacterium]|nr:glycosyltransferase family 1 protein [Candidatus Saccharimonadales bacterium]
MSDKPKHIVIDARVRQASTGRYTDRLIENLQKIDKTNRYTILVQPDDDWQMQNPNFRTVVCRFEQFSLNPLDQILFPFQLYRLKPDLVHFTMTQQPLLYFGRIVTTTHDLTMFEYARAGKFPQWFHVIRMVLYRFLLWWSHKKSRRIIVPTEYVREDLAKHQPFAKKKLVITNEASDPPIARAGERPENVPDNFIFFVGRAFPHKNLHRLVDAFEILNKKHSGLHLLLAGKKEYYYKNLDEYIRKSPAADNIHTLGYINESQLKWLYGHARAYIFPSLSEGFGLPGLEAMAHDCPVVSSNATCLPEVYGDAVEYFDPKNTEAMAEAIEKVITDEKLAKKLVEEGRKRLRKYSWQKTAEQTLGIYDSVLSD